MTFPAALAEYIEARREYERLSLLEEQAFVRWFTRSRLGERTNGAAASRAANRTSYASADMESALIALYAAADACGYDPDPDACYGARSRFIAVTGWAGEPYRSSQTEAVKDIITGRVVAQFGSGHVNRAAAEREADRRNGKKT